MSSPGNGYPQRGAPGMFLTPMNSPMFSRAQPSPRFSPAPQGRYSPTYSSQHTYSSVNSSQGRYSPTNSSQYLYSSVNSSQDGYSPRNQFKGVYSPRNPSQNSSQDGYSPRNQFQGGYSSRNPSQNSSFGGYTSTRSVSPLHQQALRQSFNKSKDSSGVSSHSSLDSTDYSRRYKPYGVNKRNNQLQQRLGSTDYSRRYKPYDVNKRNNQLQQRLGSTDYSRRYKPYDVNKWNNQNRNSWNPNKSYNIEDYILPSMLEDPWAGLKVDRNKKPEE